MIGVRGLLFFFILIFSSGSILAQPALVRSGEHSGFSRLTINTNMIGAWTLHQNEAQYTINFSDFQGGFDLGKVYERIDRARIQNVRSKGSTIELDLACTCDVDVFKAGPNMTVIDIKDRAAVTNIPKGFKIAQMALSKPVLRFPPANVGGSSKMAIPKNTLTFQYSDKVLRKPTPTLTVESTKETPSISLSNTLLPEAEILVGNLQSHLINGFGAASTRGILDLNSTVSNFPTERDVTHLTGMRPVNTSPDLASNFAINSSLDAAKIRDGTSLKEDFDLRCIASNRFNILAWSDGRPFNKQLGDANAELFDTLEVLKIDAAVKLARLYLFYGFGAEAKKIVSIDTRIHTHWPELSAIADILDGKETTSPSIFANKLECKGPIVLWATLAGATSTPSLDKNQKNILLELSRLPIHLRRIAAPKIGSYFLNAGQQLLAQSALQTLKRTEHPLTDDLDFAEGILLKANKEPAAAFEKFTAIKSNSLIAAEALIQKINLQLEDDMEIGTASLDLIDGYATEFHDTSLGIELQEVSILALSKSSQFAEALLRVTQQKTTVPTEILSKVYEDIVKFADDTTFAEYALNQIPLSFFDDDPNLAYQFANRLFNLGFHEEAEQFLFTPSLQSVNEPVAILKAKTLIALGRPAAAAVLLNGIRGSEVDQLMAQIDGMQGNHDKAAKMYKSLGDIEQELTQNWLSNRWQASGQAEDSIMADLVKVVETSVDPITPSDGMLGQIEKMLDESRQSRNSIASLLKMSNLTVEK